MGGGEKKGGVCGVVGKVKDLGCGGDGGVGGGGGSGCKSGCFDKRTGASIEGRKLRHFVQYLG